MTISTPLSGGLGGNGGGGSGGFTLGGSGGGGGGGNGILTIGTGLITISGVTIIGGNGGMGGSSNLTGGGGGGGGNGILMSNGIIVNNGTIIGGNGGLGGGQGAGSGFGGYGITGYGLTIINNGIIKGGLDASGVTQADAIVFTGGVNSLTLEAGSSITGNVVAFSPADTLALGGSTNATFDVTQIGATGQYQGFGLFEKTGTSNWTLTGAQTSATSWTVNGGTLSIANPAALGTGNVTVNNGTLTTAGGNHLINIGGNYTQGANGTLELNVLSPTVYDSVHLTSPTGVATVNGTLVLNFVGSFAPGSGQPLGLIVTNNQIAGEFSTVTTNLPSLGVTLSYTNDVTANYQTTIFQKPFATLGIYNLTQNEKSVATYIDTHDQSISNAGFRSLVGALNNASATPQTLAFSFDQLAPLKFQDFASTTAFDNNSFYIQQMNNYLANHRGPEGTFVGSGGGIDTSTLAVNRSEVDPSLQSLHSRLVSWSPGPDQPVYAGVDSKEIKDLTSEESDPWNVFISGNVVLAQNYSDTSAGLAHSDVTTGAVSAGADYKISPHWLVGGTFSYGHSSATLDDLGSDASVSTYSPGLYASYANCGWYANALGSYGFAKYNQNRNLAIGAFTGTSSSSPDGDQVVGNLDGGYDFHRGNWTFGPTLGLQYTHLEIDSYSETGLPGANLNVNSNQADSLRSQLGGQTSYSLKTASLVFTPHLSASWQHECFNQTRGITSQFNSVGAGSFVVDTPNPSRDSALVNLGLDTQINNALAAFVDYSAQAGQSNYFGQSVQAGFKIGF